MSAQAKAATTEPSPQDHGKGGYRDMSIVSIIPTSQESSAATSSHRAMSPHQTSSTAAAKILAAYDEYRERKYPQTAAFYRKMNSLTPSHKTSSLGVDCVDNDSRHDDSVTPRLPRKGASKSPVLTQRDSPRYDRAGNLRPPNKRFMQRDAISGKLVSPGPGQEDYTQLQEIQDWIKEKHYTKFDMIPNASEFLFEDMDPNFVTEPGHLRNQGRKLRVGKHGTVEIWAVMPTSTRLCMPRLVQRDGVNGPFALTTRVKDQGDETMPELDYPFGAFRNICNRMHADWTALNAVIAYVFLLSREAGIAFSDSSKWPGQLSTALNRIKQVYAPNNPHPTAATIKVHSAHAERGDMELLPTADSETIELATIKDFLRRKGILDKVEAMVSVPSIFTFKDIKVMVKAKNIQNICDRALFLGGTEQIETWAMLYQNPNKAQLSIIVNIDKMKGVQTLVQFFSDIQWTLRFPFEVFRQKGDHLSFRKMQYVIGYVFLHYGEAERALNLTDAILKHFVNITKTVKNYYGSVSPPKDSVDKIKPGFLFSSSLEADGRDDMPVPTTVKGNESGKGSEENLVSGNRSVTPTLTKANKTDLLHKPMQPILRDEVKHPGLACRTERLDELYHIPVLEDRSAASTIGLHPTYTAPAGEYRSLDDLCVSLFIENNVGQGKRRLSDQEDRATKYIRMESERIEVSKLRMYQETAIDRAKRALEEAYQVYGEEKRKTRLLHDYELSITVNQGDLTAQMTDEDILNVATLRDG